MLDIIIHKNRLVPGWLPTNDLALMLTTMHAARCTTYVEIGTLLGKSATAASMLPSIKKVISIDHYDPLILRNSDFKIERPATRDEFMSMTQKYVNDFGKSEKIILISDNSNNAKESVQTSLGEDKIDFLFIDGDHSFEQVLRDYTNYAPMLSPEGIIAIHDVARSSHAGAAKAFEIIKGSENYRFFMKSPKYGSIAFLYNNERMQKGGQP